jgi:hypothetical protein
VWELDLASALELGSEWESETGSESALVREYVSVKE